ncbi:MAG: hypothetical protein JXR12_06690 [Neptunomonas phycophila]|uniref:hypothetical protein n=1 Tax=Neptunomonas phycophila TaxID=1572645 RepID=UPI003B8BB30C
MTKITSFTSSNIDPVHADIKAALAAVGEKHGVTIGFGRITYDQGQYTTKMSVAVGNAEEAAQAEFNKYCWKFNLKESAFGTQIRASNGKMYTVCGIKPKAKTYPVIGQSADGHRLKFGAEMVDRAHRNGLGVR